MIDIILENNLTYIYNLTARDVKDLSDLLSYQIPGAQFIKTKWDKYKKLLSKTKFKEEYFFPTGLFYLVEKFFLSNNIKFNKIDRRVKPESKKYFSFTHKFKNPPLRYYQEEIINKCLEKNRGVVEAITGSGKTLTMVNLVKRLSLPTLIVTPSISILNQFHKILLDAFGKSMVGVVSSKKKEFNKEIIIANYQTLASEKIPSDFFDRFDVLCIDEFHHSASETISNLNKTKFKNIFYRFGFTATFTRGSSDLMELHGVLNEVIYEYSAPQAIRDGFLFKPTFALIDYMHNYNAPPSPTPREAFKKEYDECIIKNQAYNDNVVKIAEYVLSQNLSTIVFVDEIEHGEYISKRLSGSVFVNGKETDGKTEEIVDRFNKGEIRCIVGTSVIGEGVDTVIASCGIIAAGGKSKIETMQRVGRILRPHPTKEIALLVDFIHRGTKYAEKHSRAREAIYKREYEVDMIYNPPNLL